MPGAEPNGHVGKGIVSGTAFGSVDGTSAGASQPGRRGTVVTHGFHAPDELEREKARHAGGATVEHEPVPARSGGGSATSALEARLSEAFDEITRLREAVARLEQQVAELRGGG